MPRPTVRLRLGAGQRGRERGGRRGVADADLADDEAVDAAVGQLAGQGGAGVESALQLLVGHRGTGQQIGGAGGDLDVAHARRGVADQAEVGDQQLVAALLREHADGAVAARGRGRHLRRDLGVEQARAVHDVAVIAGEDEHAGARGGRRGRARDRRPALDQRLERAEAAGRLDELVEPVARGDRGLAADDLVVTDVRHGALPVLLHHDVGERHPRRPAGGLETRPLRALVGPADAQVGKRVDIRRDAQQRSHVVGPVEADPADAEPLRPRRQPEVLDRAARAVDVGLGDRAAAEHLDGRVAVVATDDDAERRLDDALDLLVEEVAGALVESVRLPQPLALGHPPDLDARVLALDDDQPPRLHQPDRRGAVGGREDPLEHVGRHRIGAEAADVAPLGDHAVDGGALVVGVAPAGRLGRALRGARAIEARRRRRADKAIPGGHVGEQ